MGGQSAAKMGRKRGGHAQHDGSQGGASNPVPPETAGEEGNSDAQLEGILAALGGPAEGRDLADEVDIILDVGEEGGEGDALLDSGMVAGGGSSASAQTLAQEVSAVADDAPDTHRAYPGKAETSIEQRPTVQSLQARRAAAEEVMRTRKDKGAALLLFLLLTFSVGVLLYGLREGSIEALESAEAAKTLGLFGKGFLQMVAIKDTLFIRVPAQTAVLGTLWIVVLHWRAKLMVYLSVFGSAGFGVFASAYLLFHGSNHGSLPVMIMAGLSMAITILASCRGCGTLSPEAVDVTCTAIQEAHAWMRPRRVRMTTGRWRARSLLNALDSVVLISATLLLVSLLLQAALAAGSVHVWSISAGRGIMGLFPRILLLHLFLTTAWGMSFISALHRSMISAVLSRRYFAPPEPDADGSIDVGDGTEGDGSAGISPLESLSLVLERHGTAIAKGSMVRPPRPLVLPQARPRAILDRLSNSRVLDPGCLATADTANSAISAGTLVRQGACHACISNHPGDAGGDLRFETLVCCACAGREALFLSFCCKVALPSLFARALLKDLAGFALPHGIQLGRDRRRVGGSARGSAGGEPRGRGAPLAHGDGGMAGGASGVQARDLTVTARRRRARRVLRAGGGGVPAGRTCARRASAARRGRALLDAGRRGPRGARQVLLIGERDSAHG